jgi:rod shape determining protein RodA
VRLGRDFDWVFVLCSALLSAIGLAVVYSVSQSVGEVSAVAMHGTHFGRQLVWLAMGALTMAIAFVVPFRMFESLAFTSYAVCLIMLVVVLLMPARGETQRWFVIGPLAIQPSEFTKVAVILVWARVLSSHRADPNKLRTLIPIMILSLVPFALVLKQPDLGTAMVFAGMLLPVLFWRGFRGLHILFLLSPLVSSVLIIYGENVTHNPWPFGIFIVLILIVAYKRRAFLVESISLVVANVGIGLFLPVFWNHLKPYQQRRVTNFLDPDSDKLGAGWQVIQSKIAIGSGGFDGKGYLEGTQKALEYLPAKHTDFIFSVLGEELGFVGALGVLTLFAILITRA